MSNFWGKIVVLVGLWLLLFIGLGNAFITTSYCLITKNGVSIRNIHSIEDCEKIRKFIDVQGICVRE